MTDGPTGISTDVPPQYLRQARLLATPEKPVVFVRYYPQLHRWVTFHAVAPLVSRAPETPATATAVITTHAGQSFRVPAAHAPILRPIFSIRTGGVSFANHELSGLEQAASVVRVMHVVHMDNAASAGLQGHSSHTSHHSAGHTRHQSTAPQRLTYSTVPTSPGQKYWTIRWHLAHSSPKGGWIVQHIIMNIAPAGAQPGRHLDYWEAWQIPRGSQSTIYLNMVPYDDMFRAPTNTHTTGSARFYEGLALPPSFVPNNAATAAGILPATTSDPKLPTQNATARVKRNWTAP